MANEITIDGKTYILTFSEEFDTPHDTFWHGWGSGGIWNNSYSPHLDDTRYLVGNAVKHYFVDDDDPDLTSPFSFTNGALTTTAVPVQAGQEILIDGQQYTSGIMTTELTYGFTYGYVEVRADVPDEQGVQHSIS